MSVSRKRARNRRRRGETPARSPAARRHGRDTTVREDLREGMMYAALGFGGLTLVALAGAAVVGTFAWIAGEPIWREMAVILPRAIVAYALAAAVGGLVIGLLRPLHRRFAGRMLTTVLLGLLLYGSIGFALHPLLDVDRETFRGVLLVLAVAVVPASAYAAHRFR